MKIDYASHSRLSTYKTCPLKYKFEYEDKLPRQEKDYFAFGSFIHKVFELVVSQQMDLSSAFNLAEKENYMFANEYRKRFIDIFTNFNKFQKMMKENIEKEHAEQEFLIPMNESNPDLKIKGFIDRTIFLKNGKILILDYKTTKPYSQIKHEHIHNDPQLLTYIWASSKLYDVPINKISAQLFYLDNNHQPKIETPDENLVKKHIENCYNISLEIKNTKPEDAKPIPNKMCKFCDFNNRCIKGKLQKTVN